LAGRRRRGGCHRPELREDSAQGLDARRQRIAASGSPAESRARRCSARPMKACFGSAGPRPGRPGAVRSGCKLAIAIPICNRRSGEAERNDDGSFGVEFSSPENYPATISKFATEVDAEAWIAKHKRWVHSENELGRWFRKSRRHPELDRGGNSTCARSVAAPPCLSSERDAQCGRARFAS